MPIYANHQIVMQNTPVNLMLFPVCCGTDAIESLERPGKVKLVVKSQHVTYLFNRDMRVFQV